MFRGVALPKCEPLLLVVALLLWGVSCSTTCEAFDCPQPPAQVGEGVDRKKLEGELDVQLGKLIKAGDADLKGSLNKLSKKVVKEYDGVNEGMANLMIGSFCCQKANEITDPAQSIRLWRECMGFAEAGAKPEAGARSEAGAKPEAPVKSEAPKHAAVNKMGATDDRPPSAVPTQLTIEQDDVRFHVNHCERSGNKLSCTVQFTNTSRKRLDFIVYHSVGYGGGYSGSYMLDNLGNQYHLTTLSLGSHTSGPRWGYPGLSEQLEVNLPIKSEMTAIDVAPEADNVSIVVVYEVGRQRSKVVLANVPISRR